MQLIDAIFGEREAPATSTRSGRLHDAARAMLYALVAAAVWGVGVGAGHLGQALANVYRVPLVVLISAVATLPAGLLLWRVFEVSDELDQLVLAYARATFHGALSLAAFAPLLGIYSFTSAPSLVSVLAVAAVSFVRQLAGVVFRGQALRALPVALVCLAIQLAALPQLISIMSPILPSPTSLAGGVEGLFSGAR